MFSSTLAVIVIVSATHLIKDSVVILHFLVPDVVNIMSESITAALMGETLTMTT